MKLYNYKRFNDYNNDIHESIHKICQKYIIKNYNINPDGSVDVQDDVHLSRRKLKQFPLNFNKVDGHFYCFGNELTSLKGAPKYVGSDFDCRFNILTSLEGSPEYVGGFFDCGDNQLKSLKGLPESIGGYLDCRNNKLTSLEGLTGNFDTFFDCSGNYIRDFIGFPELYYYDIYFHRNPVNEILNPVPHPKRCEFIHLLNDYDVIRNGQTIIRDRLEAAYEGIGLELQKNIKIEGYEII